MHPLVLLALLQVGTVGAQHAGPLRQHPTTCYEVFVRSFYDSNGDGIGDLRGLTQKLDYISGLGADCVWLMPVAESPSYHGYDVTDYNRIEPDYGTNDDFKAFVATAHQHGIRVLVDLVLNHTSSQHPWFQEALQDTASPHRSWYRWSKTPGNNWHKSPVRDEYYFGLFWSGMPDLNYENPAVLEEMKRVARFWLDSMQVDGFRLDAVRHLVEVGNEFSNTPATHQVLRDFGQYVRSIAPPPRSYTIGEVWDNTDVILTYYPDQLDAYFAFPISEALMEAVRTLKAGGLLPTVEQFARAEPAWRWAPFQRNHDQTRTMTALGNDTAGAKLAATILLTLPGVPFVYYGEEIGMTGDKPDERLRTPMQWSASSRGFTSGKPWESLQSDTLTANVAVEDGRPGSLLNLYRKLTHLRATNGALREGRLEPIESGNESVLAYMRVQDSSAVLVLVNLGGTAASAPAPSSLVGSLPAPAVGVQLQVGWRDLLARGNPRRRSLPVLAPRRAYVYELSEVVTTKRTNR